MAGMTTTESKEVLDARYPTGATTDKIAYSLNGTSAWSGLAASNIGSYAAATNADPSVKANAAEILSAGCTATGQPLYFQIQKSDGTPRGDWTLFSPAPSTLSVIGDQLRHPAGTVGISLT